MENPVGEKLKNARNVDFFSCHVDQTRTAGEHLTKHASTLQKHECENVVMATTLYILQIFIWIVIYIETKADIEFHLTLLWFEQL